MRTARRSVAVLVAMAALLASAGSAPTAASPSPAISPPGCRIPLAAPRIDSPSATLRITLGRLLGEHAFLVMETMRAVALDAPDLEALREGLDDNSQDLQDAIAGIYGAEAAASFGELWQRHVDLLVEYAEARAAGDTRGAESATAGLAEYREEFAALLATVNPELDAEAEAEALRLHIEQLIAFADDDYDKAYAVAREAFTHMFRLGDDLARGIGRQFPDQFTGATIAFSPGNELRVALDRLLAEHLVLSAEAMRANLADAPDRAAAEGSLALNAQDLAEAVGELYGGGAGTAFGQLWTDHIDAYLAFIAAVRSDDDAAREASLSSLHAYHDQLAAFLGSANPFLDADAVAGMILQHVESLVAQVEAYDAGDYRRAVTTIRAAYAQMFEVGDALAAAIVQQFPDRFEELREIPPTATDGPLDVDGASSYRVFAILLGAGAIMLIVAALADRRATAIRLRRRRRP